MSNPNADAILQQAQALIKSGRRNEARPLLERLVNLDDQNEAGWLYLSACVDSLDEQKICLENVLMLNPNNQRAMKGLDVVKQQIAMRAQSARPAAPPPPQPATPAASAEDFGSPYDSGSFNAPGEPVGYSDSSYASSGYDDLPGYDAPSTSSSVDWGKGSAPAYGSGQNVPQPTAREFDSWVAKLPLGGKAKEVDEPPPVRVPQTMRSTADMPPVDFTATEEQFNIPSPYDGNDDPFRASFDGPDAGTFAPPPASVSPFDMADLEGGLEGAPNFDFADFGGPFSANTSSTPAAPAAPTDADYGYSADSPHDSNMFKFDTNTFSKPDYAESSYEQNPYALYEQPEQSGTSFGVPGGFSDPLADSGEYGSPPSSGGTSADRFKFGGTESGAAASKGSRRGVELPGSSGLFRDNPLDSSAEMSAPIIDYDDDELGNASGVFGMAARKGDSSAKRPEGMGKQTSPQAPRRSASAPATLTSQGPFRLIPPEIKGRGAARAARRSVGNKFSIGALVSIVLLIILNVASLLVLIFFNLRGMGLV